MSKVLTKAVVLKACEQSLTDAQQKQVKKNLNISEGGEDFTDRIFEIPNPWPYITKEDAVSLSVFAERLGITEAQATNLITGNILSLSIPIPEGDVPQDFPSQYWYLYEKDGDYVNDPVTARHSLVWTYSFPAGVYSWEGGTLSGSYIYTIFDCNTGLIYTYDPDF